MSTAPPSPPQALSATKPQALLARAAWAACTGLVVLPAAAQNAGGLRVTPALDTTLSVVHSTLGAEPSNDAVLQIRPGVLVTAGGGRVRGRLDYGLNAVFRSRSAAGQGQADSLQNYLNASLSAEVIERWAFVDATATITQQAISAFGQQSADGTQVNPNRSEVSQLSIRPHAQGVLAGAVSYQVGLSASATHASGVAQPNSNSTGLNLGLGSVAGGALFGWSAQGTQQRTSFGGRATDSGRLSVSLLIRPNPEWNASLRGGQETTSIGSVYRKSYNNWGGDLRWTPSVRTTALVSTDERYFGRAYQVLLEHRFPQSNVRYTSTRDANNAANATGVGQPTSLYQLFYAQFASIQPDPALREQLVRNTLLALRLDGNAVVGGGFVNGGTTLQRRDDLAFSYTGRRTVMTLQGFSSDTRLIDTTAVGVDAMPVRQEGLTATVSYRLTPTANVNLTGSGLRTHGTATQAGNRLATGSIGLSNQLNRYLGANVSARYSVFSGAINPYRESALSASLNLRF